MPRRIVTALALAGVAWGAASATAAHAAVVPPAKADYLSITVRGTGDATKNGAYGLLCHPSGGSHPRPEAACDALDAAMTGKAGGTHGTRGPGRGGPFAPVPRDTPCTMIHGGPATARITGIWHGRSVDARFDRSNGCEMARWDRLVPALPAVGRTAAASNDVRS